LQKGNVEKNISAELPFATIYMSAIAGSNVEPIRIFKILNSTPEYPYIGTELKKIINQVELYGLDLVNSLKNTALTATNRKFAELLGGMATNILSGGSLKNYLDKKAENYLADYKLEMEKYSAIAGTFMDIYISVLITAPLILMMVFVVVQLTGMGSFSSVMIFVLSIGGVVVANLIFLFVLHIKQPK
jgi:flagellar protein FlaJ